MSRKTFFPHLIILGLLLSYCTRKVEDLSSNPDLSTERLHELMPLQRGKFITYRLDSIVPIRQGRALEVHRYQVKDVVDTIITDALGRAAYRVYRYRNDSLGAGTWTTMSTYLVTHFPEKIEVLENNLRTVKLRLPLRPDFSWKGASLLPDAAYGYFNDARLNEVWDWDYTYTGVGAEKIGRYNFDSVWTVQHMNEVADTVSIPAGARSPHHGFYIIGFSEEKFVPKVGMVARQFIALQNEPNKIDSVTYDPYRTGYGVRMWMIDHN